LKKNSRLLKLSALTALRDLITAQRSVVQPALLGRVIDEIPPLLSDQDLHLTYLSLELLTAILRTEHAELAKRIEGQPLNSVVNLLRSSLLQGHALAAAQNFFELLAKKTTLGYKGLLDKAISAANDAGSKQAYSSIAQVVASIASSGTDANRKETVERFAKQLGSDKEPEVLLALYCVGEIGFRTDLATFPNLASQVRAQFDSQSEECKSAASLALGRICAGNIKLLDGVLSEINSNEKHRYLLLRSLKETIMSAPHEPLQARIEGILPLLFQYSQAEEEGVRNVVAECLGKLALVEPRKVMDRLKDLQPQSNQKACIITALKYTITEQPQPIDAVLLDNLPYFFTESLKAEESVKIRRAGVLLLTAAVHNKPNLVRGCLGQCMPALYKYTEVDKSLIREISLGPFKHKVDDGLELRKAAFECLDIMLDHTSGVGSGSLLDYLNDHTEFIAHLQNGLASENLDIKTLAHLMLTKLTRMPSATVALLASLTEISEKLKVTVTTKLKANTVRQEQERHDDVIKSALRAIEHLSKVNGALDNPSFKQLYTEIIPQDKEIKTLHDRVLQEREGKEQ
jgi:cullin-associated NEDD8-dissociated protein 1